MHRRHFLTTLAAAGTFGSAAHAFDDAFGGRLQVGAYYPVRVNQNGDSTRIDHLVVTDGSVSLSLDWSSGAALYPENRFDLSGLQGVIGDLFRTPFRVRWRRAQPLGHVELNAGRNMLIARVADAGRLAGSQATLGAGQHSWDLPGRFAPGTAPAEGRAVGAARLEADGRLLIDLPQMVAQF